MNHAGTGFEGLEEQKVRGRLLMKRLAYTCSAVVVLLIAVRWYLSAYTPISFNDLPDAVSCIRVAGFHVTSDRIDGEIQTGFLVTAEQATWKDANDLVKVNKIGPEWKGKVWVTIIGETGAHGVVPEEANARTWGRVCAYGDKDLLNQVEYALQRVVQQQSSM